MPDKKAERLHNLLDEGILGVEAGDGERTRVTLPGLLARLSRGEASMLTAVQAHQQHAVHAFLVQLASIAMWRAGKEELPREEQTWRAMLVAAAKADGGDEDAYSLIVGDLKRAAFMQPPVPEGTLGVLKNVHTQPSAELDVLITSKNHDVKADRLQSAGAELWLYALLTLQTMQGFLGKGNYGIARMNGGFASRPCVAFAPGHDSSERFRRDVRVLLGARQELVDDQGFSATNGLGLVWCAPWDGTASLPFAKLDPFFIEVCRRIRLATNGDGETVAYRGSSTAPRVDSKEANGKTGDGWTPVAIKDGKALTMSENGFGYDRVQDLLFGEWKAGAAGEPDAESRDRLWVGQVLVRGQGKTGGYHERWVDLPVHVRRKFAKRQEREQLGERSKAWVDKAMVARLRVLKPSLLTLLQGGPEKLKVDDNRADSYLTSFDVALDGRFFELLFAHADDEPEQADSVFERALVELARAELDRACGALPVPTARRWRAEAHAYRTFFGAARKQFKLAFEPAKEASAEAQTTEGESP